MEGRKLGLERCGFAEGGGCGRGELGLLRRFRRLALHGLAGGVRFRLYGGEQGAEVLDLLGGRFRCFAGGGIGSVRPGLCHGLCHRVGELVM